MVGWGGDRMLLAEKRLEQSSGLRMSLYKDSRVVMQRG